MLSVWRLVCIRSLIWYDGIALICLLLFCSVYNILEWKGRWKWSEVFWDIKLQVDILNGSILGFWKTSSNFQSPTIVPHSNNIFRSFFIAKKKKRDRERKSHLVQQCLQSYYFLPSTQPSHPVFQTIDRNIIAFNWKQLFSFYAWDVKKTKHAHTYDRPKSSFCSLFL